MESQFICENFLFGISGVWVFFFFFKVKENTYFVYEYLPADSMNFWLASMITNFI